MFITHFHTRMHNCWFQLPHPISQRTVTGRSKLGMPLCGFETGRMEPRHFPSFTSTKSHYVTGPTTFPAVVWNPRYVTHSGANSYHLARFQVLTPTLLKMQVFRAVVLCL
jgi:hypothetical protein